MKTLYLTIGIMAMLLVGARPAASQSSYVEGVSAIINAGTSSTQIETYSETFETADIAYYYEAYVEGYLYQNGGLIADGSALGSPYANDAYGYMTQPLHVPDTYEIQSDHYLVAYYTYYDASTGTTYYENPDYFTNDGGFGGSNDFLPGSSSCGCYYETVDYIFLGTTAVQMSSAPPAISSISPAGVSLGDSGTLTIDGIDLIDVFTGTTTATLSGSGISWSVVEQIASQVMISYSVSTTAPTGSRTLTLATRFGQASTTFNVGDGTPVVTSISPGTWGAGTTTSVTFGGRNFGTSPTLSFSTSDVSATITSSSNTQIVANVTVTECAPNQSVTITVQSHGYNGSGFIATSSGQSSSGTDSATIQAIPTETVSLTRLSLVQIKATGTPSGGTFSYSVAALNGTSLAGISFASGVTSTTNPNTANLSDPSNPTTNGTPSPGGLAKITAKYAGRCTTGTDSFQVPTFGMSCYYTTLQSDWGSPPSSCASIPINGITYSGTVTNPNGLTGTYCSSFIAEVKLQGSATLNNGTYIQYNPSTKLISTVSQITGSDGTAVVANKTVARDKGAISGCTKTHYAIIPGKGVLLNIDQIGTGLLANDIGCDIIGYRLDLYKGSGKAVCSNFNNRISVSACSPGSTNCPASAIQ